MARQARTSTHPLTPMKWLNTFIQYGLEGNWFGQSGLIGDGPDSLIRVFKDLTVTKGNKIRVPMTGPLQGVGGGDNFNSADVMTAYDTFYQDTAVHERGITTGISGPMALQYMIEDWPKEATEKVGGWHGIITELEYVQALCGLYNLSTTVESVNEHSPVGTASIAYGGETAAGVVHATSALGDGTVISTGAATFVTDSLLTNGITITDILMGPNFLEACVLQFMNREPRPQPLTIEGRRCLLLLMTPWQARAMRANATYIARNTYAEVRGNKNPLLSDSLGFWACGEVSVLLKPYGRMPYRTSAGGVTPKEGFTLNTARTITSDPVIGSGKTVGRALLLGAQAGTIAYGDVGGGQMVKRFKGDLDNNTGRKPFYGIDTMYGVSVTQFKNEAGTSQNNFACMCLDTGETH